MPILGSGRRTTSKISKSNTPSTSFKRKPFSAGKENIWSIIEAIEDHSVNEDGSLKFLIKWKGWEDESDRTWEPEDQLKEDVPELLSKYMDEIEGPPKGPKRSVKAAEARKRPRTSINTTSPTRRTRRVGTGKQKSVSLANVQAWKPPAGSWEEEIDSVDACEFDESGELIVYLAWRNGQKTRHDTSVVYKKCPQKDHGAESGREEQLIEAVIVEDPI